MKIAGSLVVMLALAAACGGDDADDADAGAIDATPPGGTLTLSWTIEDPGGAPLECGDVGATGIAMTGVPSDAVIGFNDLFGCASGMGTTSEVASALYDLTIDLRTTGGVSVLEEPVVVLDVQVASGGAVVLDPVVFTVSPPPS